MTNQIKYCPSCGEELQIDMKFCTACGKKMDSSPKQMTNEDVDFLFERKKKSRIPILTALLILAIVVVGYFGYGILQIDKPTAFDAETTLTACEGTYTDMTGMLTGIKNGEIDVVSRNKHLVGTGKTGDFSFDLVVLGNNHLSGEADLKGVVSQHTVFYNLDKKRLTFTRDGTPLDWYIEKVKR
jgi:predicted nucleic acid-binding Zn ribbon protein